MDKTIHGDEIHGDKILGDKIGGNKTVVGDVTGGTGIGIGSGVHTIVKQGWRSDEIGDLFAAIYGQVEQIPESLDVDQEELTETVQRIEQETVKGDQANPKKIERWLKMLALMSSDIFEVTVACLTGPVAGVAEVIRKVAEKAKKEAKNP